MAYITEYNFSRLRLIQTSNLKIIVNRIYGEPILCEDEEIDSWFSDIEINQLLIWKALIENNPNKYGDVLKLISIPEPKDDFRYAYKPTKPSYHKDKDCEFLYSNYNNFELPVGLLEAYGEEGVKKFREWFKLKGEDLVKKGKNEQFLTFVESVWGDKKDNNGYIIQVNWEEFIRVQEKNSGVAEPQGNPSLLEIISEIELLKIKFRGFRNKLSERQKQLFDKYISKSYLYSKKYKIPGYLSEEEEGELRKNLENFSKDFKCPMRDHLIAYYALVAGNYDLRFEDNLLRALGFKPCAHCCTDEIRLK